MEVAAVVKALANAYVSGRVDGEPDRDLDGGDGDDPFGLLNLDSF
jgi:hypothetical protein